jgi:hypothetical protein
MEIIKLLEKDENHNALVKEFNIGSLSLHDIKIRKVICLNLFPALRLIKALRNAKQVKVRTKT